MHPIPKITLDNNCVINLMDRQSTTATSVEELIELMKLGLSNKVDIAITTRVAADLANDKNDRRREEMLRNAQMFPVIGTVARFNVSIFDSGDVFGSEETSRIAEELKTMLFPGGIDPQSKTFPNKINDVDHLLGHLINQRDIFVTDDGGILRKKFALKVSPGIIVMSPADALRYIDELESSRNSVSLEPKNIDANYISRQHAGQVSFDYSNNNGVFIIGDGIYTFETKWSKASDVSIHAYAGSGSIDSLALAKGVSEMNDIKDASTYDYSSRTRTPRENQVVIFKNKNGIYAALKINEIEDDTRGAENDLLSFEYRINEIGETSFGT